MEVKFLGTTFPCERNFRLALLRPSSFGALDSVHSGFLCQGPQRQSDQQ